MSMLELRTLAESIRKDHHELAKLRYDFARIQIEYHNAPNQSNWDNFRRELDKLARHLLLHFSEEEARDGFLEVVKSILPDRQTEVAALRQEHIEMRELIGGLSSQVGSPPPVDLREFNELAPKIKQLFSLLSEHDSVENRLIYGVLEQMKQDRRSQTPKH